MEVKKDDIYHISFFNYGEAFYGSIGNLRYRVARLPFEDVRYDRNPDKNKDAHLELITWKGPLNFTKTTEEKIHKEFAFSEEGLEEIVAYLNEEFPKY